MMFFAVFLLMASVVAGTPEETSLLLEEFSVGNNLFTANVYRELLKENKGNFLASPFSVETVLALAQSGARGETAEEIRNSLHLPNSTEKIEATYKALLPRLKENEYYSLNSADKIYVNNGYLLKDDYLKVAKDVYNAEAENVDFALKSEAAQAINSWVAKQTHDKIQDLVEPTSLNEKTRVVLVNALYFKGKWLHPFEGYATSKRDFYKTAKDVVKVDTMHNVDTYNYYDSKELNAKFLEMKYEGDDVSIVFVLPNEKEGLSALEAQVEKVFTEPKFTEERVSVFIPRFSIETKILFSNVLKNLGIKRAFDENADFSGIAGEKGDLVVSAVIQKSFINVTEIGTEASAATAVPVETKAGGVPAYLVQFRADRPFIFYIQYNNYVLFGGRIISPSL